MGGFSRWNPSQGLHRQCQTMERGKLAFLQHFGFENSNLKTSFTIYQPHRFLNLLPLPIMHVSLALLRLLNGFLSNAVARSRACCLRQVEHTQFSLTHLLSIFWKCSLRSFVSGLVMRLVLLAILHSCIVLSSTSLGGFFFGGTRSLGLLRRVFTSQSLGAEF